MSIRKAAGMFSYLKHMSGIYLICSDICATPAILIPRFKSSNSWGQHVSESWYGDNLDMHADEGG